MELHITTQNVWLFIHSSGELNANMMPVTSDFLTRNVFTLFLEENCGNLFALSVIGRHRINVNKIPDFGQTALPARTNGLDLGFSFIGYQNARANVFVKN